jgi:L-lactate dehydrogenase complex protein LldE
MRVSLFVACFNDLLFPDTGKAIVQVLERLGHTVDFPAGQTCCGQLHFNTGYQQEIVPLVRRFVDTFEDADAVVAASGSCGGMVREHYRRMAEVIGEPALARRIDALVPRVFEFSELLVDRLGVTDVGAYFPHRVTYHPTCHALRMLHVDAQPLALLRAVRGIDLVDLPAREECCGFGGTFAVKNAEVSTAMLSDKLRHVLDTDAEVLAAADNSCLMHIGGGLRRQQTGVRTMHVAEILAAGR